MATTRKRCRRCGIVRGLTSFETDLGAIGGYAAVCRSCPERLRIDPGLAGISDRRLLERYEASVAAGKPDADLRDEIEIRVQEQGILTSRTRVYSYDHADKCLRVRRVFRERRRAATDDAVPVRIYRDPRLWA